MITYRKLHILEQYNYMESRVKDCWMCLTPQNPPPGSSTACVGCVFRNVRCEAQPPPEGVATFALKQNIQHVLRLRQQVRLLTGIDDPEQTAMGVSSTVPLVGLALLLDQLLRDTVNEVDATTCLRTAGIPTRPLRRRASWAGPSKPDKCELGELRLGLSTGGT